MTDTLDHQAVSAAPEYPMGRTASCPFAPPKPMLEMNETKPLSRVRIWNGTTPWLITGHEVA
ncbi:cytochrome P450, partial [Mycobacterium sp. ITM-2017-0098]